MWWPAPAKLNLFLHITGRRADGYHDIQTLFQLLDYGDRLRFKPRNDGVISRSGGLSQLTEAQDMAVKAAHLLQDHAGVGLGVDIEIEKALPAGAGLGGGSSDAATVLVALNAIWAVGLEQQQLARLGQRLGADLPVFVHGQTAWAEGMGEKLTPLPQKEAFYLVITPDCHISTAALYNHPELTRHTPPLTIARFSQADAGNNFEPLVRRLYPEVGEALDWLSSFSRAYLTGTGASVFARFASQVEAESVAKQVSDNWQVFIAQGVNRSPLLEALDVYAANI